MSRCRVCDREESDARFSVREMMFGLREQFEYYQCSACGSLNIAEPPENLGRYYPSQYYSFAAPNENGPLKRFLKRHLARSALGGVDVLGALLCRRYGVREELRWLLPTGVGFDSPILDVGCGAGHFLYWLWGAGFCNLTGIDPFLPRETTPRQGLRILKEDLANHEGEYDLVMLNHSLEHVENPASTLRHVRRLLRPGHFAIVRLPLADSNAWRTYGVDWVALDAPRHLFIPTEEGIGLLADRAGLAVSKAIRDSTALQFWGSEQYRRDVPLRDGHSYAVNPSLAPFSTDEIHAFERMADERNAIGDGDQACFYLRRTEDSVALR